jgi:hypothetical protein
MPYVDGKRISNQEWSDRFSSLRQFPTGPNGENPAEPPELDAETKAPKSEKKAGSKRSKNSGKKVTDAIADATGAAVADLPDITGLDAEPETTEAEVTSDPD